MSWMRKSAAARIVVTALLIAGGITAVHASPAAAVDVCGTTPDTTWDGDTSSTWSDPLNWSSGVPTASSRVCVPADMPNNPIIAGGFNAEVDTIEVQIGATLNINGGSLDIANTSSIATLTLNGANTQLFNDGTLTVDTAFNMTQGAVSGTGSIISVIGANFATTSPKTIDQNFTNQGILTWNDGNLNFVNNTVTNSGQWRVPGTADVLTASAFNNGGSLTKSNAGTVTIDANFTNTGTTTSAGTATLIVPAARSFTVSGGEVASNGAHIDHGVGTIAVNGGRTYTDATGTMTSSNFTVGGGILSGDGTYIGDVTVNSGEVTGGTFVTQSTGSLDITGNLTFNGGALRADIKGTSAGSNYDTVAVSGNVTINGGQLDARGTGYQPAALSTYNVLSYAGITGTLGLAEDINDFPFTGTYTSDYGASPLTLTARYNGRLQGNAFIDNNSNGNQDGGENTARTGVTVYIDSDNDGVQDGGEPTRGVDGNGYFQFDNIAPANYNVRTTGAPFGYIQSTANPRNVTLGDGATVNANFGFYESISIGGNVYADNDRSGTNNAGDGPASGVNVFLDTNSDGIRQGGETQVTTDGSGNYLFGGLPPATYNVRLNLPAGGNQTTGNPGPVVVSSGNSVANVNFGVDLITGSIAGAVYVDTDGDGTKDGGETAAPAGSVAFLDTNHNGTLDGGERTASLDVNGNYLFTVVNPGTYDVDATLPAGFTQTSTELDNVVVGTNQDVTGQNIGLFQAPGISGTVYSDVDGNAAQDPGDGGLGGIQVYLDLDSSGAFTLGEPARTTDAGGNYNFDALSGGTYKVRVTVPNPGTQSSANPSDIVVTSNNGASDVDFGLQVTGDVSGTAYEDVNGNGVQDSGDTTLLANVQVFADVNGNDSYDSGEPTDDTDVNGDYELAAVPSNTYDILVVLPTGKIQTSAVMNGVTIGANADLTGRDIGLFTLTSISGVAYEDANEDGVLDTGEDPAVNFSVYLDVNNNGNPDFGEPQTTTNAGGEFTFDNLGPGPHAIRPSFPPGADGTTAIPVIVPLNSGEPNDDVEIGVDIYGTVSGNIFVDTDGDGVRDGGETSGLNGAVVFIDDNHNGLLDAGEKSVTANVNGDYRFDLVLPGPKDIDVVLADNLTQTTNELDAVAFPIINQDLTGNDIGVYADGTITGTVFFDADGGAAFDTGEPGIKGATVYIDANNNSRYDAGEPTALTADNGVYTFTGQKPGGKTVRVLRWINATQTTLEPAAVTVSSGTVFANLDFGMDKPVVGSAAPSNQGTGYWMVGVDGHVYAFGEAKDFGSVGELSSPAVGLAPTPTGNGYWVATAGGGVQSFGDARFYGAPAQLKLNKPVIDIVSTPSGNGYWVLAADGGVFSYGDAQFFGSTGSLRLNAPVVGMAATGDGKGYWLVAADGGVFAYGTAAFKGSMGGKPLNKPVVGIIGTSTGDGYLLVAADGGMFVYDAPFLGSAATLKLEGPIVAVKARGDGRGYWLVGEDGGLFAYGQAPFYGNAKVAKTAPITG